MPTSRPLFASLRGTLGATLLCGALAVFATSCSTPPPDSAPADMSPAPLMPVVACPGAAIPTPPDGQRCTATPAQAGSKRVLLRGTVLLPEQVLHNGQVVLDDTGRIACAACDCAAESAGAAVVACPDGVISPGLINAHDHITYTKAAPGTHATNRYDHRHEWRLGVSGDPNRPKIDVPGGNSQAAIQYGELRQVLAGTTSLSGSGSAPGLLRNIDTAVQEGLGQRPLSYDTFPLGDSSGDRRTTDCGYPSIRDEGSVYTVDAYTPHISEGINAAAHNEFVCTSSSENGAHDLIQNRTAFMHGIGLTAADARTAAQRGAALIWSPRSNIALYGHTAQAPMFDRAGALIALGTDWTASGSMNILRELRCASDFNKTYLDGYFSPEALWRMVTVNAAFATGTADAIGQIQKGYVGDIAIFQGKPGAQDHAAVVSAQIEDVLAVLRGGQPLYGDAAVLEALGAGDAGKCEAIDICTVKKRLCVERETGRKLADLEVAAKPPIYQLFACGTPPSEPSCVPARVGEYTGLPSADDRDGDGRPDAQDNCPGTFNPVRPMDAGNQPDSDGDGLGDACDPCPLDKDTMLCQRADPQDGDADGVPDSIDNCLTEKNTDQIDSDQDGQGDACDSCPFFKNPGLGPCPFTARQIRDPALSMRPRLGSKVTIFKLLVVALRDKTSFGFHARDYSDDPASDSAERQAYTGILVFTGGSAPPKAFDGTPIQVGHVVALTGSLTVYQNQDEIEKTTELRIVGFAPDRVRALDVRTRDFVPVQSPFGESHENLLVRVRDVTMKRLVAPVMPPMPLTDDDFFVTDDPGETCMGATPACARIGDFLLDKGTANMQPPFTADGKISAVTGVVNGFQDTYSIEPRTAADIQP